MNYNKIKNFNINNYKKSKKIKINLTTIWLILQLSIYSRMILIFSNTKLILYFITIVLWMWDSKDIKFILNS